MPADLSADELARAKELLGGISMSDNLIKNTLTNPKLTRSLVEVISTHGFEQGCDKAVGALVVMVGSKFPGSALKHRATLMTYIRDGRIATNDQVEAALKHLKTVGDADLDVSKFEKASGVGIVVSEADVQAAVSSVLAQHADAIKEERYQYNFKKLLQPIKAIGDLAWAPISTITAEIDKQAAAMLGPKTAEDEKPREKPKKVKAPKEKNPAQERAAADDEAWKTADPYAFLPRPEDNYNVHTEVQFSDGHIERYSNTRAQLEKHLKETGGKVVTRFPPEPNGYLHIGHAKAMFVDFGMARRYNGVCYLRFDDTNPEAEKLEYIEHIQEIVRWMGWEPWKITYSSDYFQELHDLAVQLIRDGHAYVCHQAADEIKAAREQKVGSPWRDRPKEESLKLFAEMRRGLWDEGTATLRLRMDPQNVNGNMFDLIAYRIKFVEHPHAGDAWCVYPSYDYTHCIVDALENVTHSLCTLEFESRRASYYWLLERVRLYKPLVWEYARLNITNNVMSKRKLQKLVNGNYIRGWDDPRMMTLAGMRRRGITPEAINSLCREIGITRSDNEIPIHKLEHHVRNHLDETSPRALAVLRPLRLVITNLPESHFEEVKALDFPGRSEAGYNVPFTRVVYIERGDFRPRDEKDYYGLAPGKAVMLRYAYPVTYERHTTDAAGEVVEVAVTYDKDFMAKGKPPKGVLNWVGQPSPGKLPTTFEARLYSELFKSKSPAELENWLEDLNPESEVVVKGGFLSTRLEKAQVGERFQFERLGYFCKDTASAPGNPVFNRTVTLRDSYAKGK